MKHLLIYSLLFVSIFFFLGEVSTAVFAQELNPNDISNSNIISCYNNCGFEDIFRTINNGISFFFTTLFLPIVVIMFMYAGYTYLMARGDPKNVVKVKSLLWNIFRGILVILLAWLVVRTILNVILRAPEPNEPSPTQFLDKQ